MKYAINELPSHWLSGGIFDTISERADLINANVARIFRRRFYAG